MHKNCKIYQRLVIILTTFLLSTPSIADTLNSTSISVVDSPIGCSGKCRLQDVSTGTDETLLSSSVTDGVSSASSSVHSSGLIEYAVTRAGTWDSMNHVAFINTGYNLSTTTTGGELSFELYWDLIFQSSHDLPSWDDLTTSEYQSYWMSKNIKMHVYVFESENETDIAPILSWNDNVFFQQNYDMFRSNTQAGFTPWETISVNDQQSFTNTTGSSTYNLGVFDPGHFVILSFDTGALATHKQLTSGVELNTYGTFGVGSLTGVSYVPLPPALLLLLSGIAGLFCTAKLSFMSTNRASVLSMGEKSRIKG